MITWFVFDLGNTLIRLAYERVLVNLCRRATVNRDQMLEVLEEPGGYRDLERGAITFREFYDFLSDRAGYRGSFEELRSIWSDFFDGPVEGAEELLTRVRSRYRVAFLSNSNEIHAEVIPRQFGALFRKDDRFIFSHRFRVAKPDSDIFRRALEVVGALPPNVAYVDDLIENVTAARECGLAAYQFLDTPQLVRELERDGLL